LLLVVVVYLGFAHAEHQGDHVSVDLVYDRLGLTFRRIADVMARAVSLVIVGLVTWQLWRYAGVQEAGQYTTAVLEWRIHWFVRVAAVGAALLWLALLTEIVVDLLRLDGDEGSDSLTSGGAAADEVAP
jgi:TRAP-type C4-dicarboxylate transport system permease small subunit